MPDIVKEAEFTLYNGTKVSVMSNENIIIDNNKTTTLITNNKPVNFKEITPYVVKGDVYKRSSFVAEMLKNITSSNIISHIPEKNLNVRNVIAGNNRSTVIDSKGNIYRWGLNNSGELGDGTTKSKNTPTRIKGDLEGKNIVHIEDGDSYSVGLSIDGRIYCWGHNEVGSFNVLDPVEITSIIPLGGTEIVSIACGTSHSLARDVSGRIYTWGDNKYGQLGDGTNMNNNMPDDILTTEKIVSIGSGNNHSLAIDSIGSVYAWGDNSHGQIGNGKTGNGKTQNSYLPVQVKGEIQNKCIVSVSGGDKHSIALDSNGRVYSWGSNIYGQLGIGDPFNVTEPVQVKGLLLNKNIVFIKAKEQRSIAIDSEGNLYIWGNDRFGVNSRQSFFYKPVRLKGVLEGKYIESASLGKDHAFAMDSDGKIYGWGRNIYNELLADDEHYSVLNRYVPAEIDINF